MQEEIKVAAGKLKDTLKAIIREGNVRRIVVRNADGRTLLDMPIAAGVIGAVLAPFWAAVAGIVMLAKEFTVVIERDPDKVVKVSE
jgi:integral membrane sensor domain MASE1